MRKILLGSGAAAVALGSLTIVPPSPVAAADQANGSFCRNADSLPPLAKEADWQTQPEARDRSGGRMMVREAPYAAPVADIATVAVPAPPPPPPPAPASTTPMMESGTPIVVTGSSDSPAAVVDEESGESVVVSATRADASAPAAAERSDKSRHRGDRRIMPPPRPQPQPQAGLLTAGEHDDLLNPELYAAYVRRSNLAQSIPDLPRVDTMNVVTVRVADASGRAVPFADVKVTCSDGNSIIMATQADGTAVFFPGLDRLSERISVSARKGGVTIADARPVLVSRQPGAQMVGLTAAGGATKADKLDLMFVIDTTGSMGDEISYLQSELRSIISAVTSKHRGVDIRLGFVFYRDMGDDYVTYTVDFDRDIGKQQGVLARQNAGGGGDYPEAMDQALIRAVGQAWRPDAVKSLFLVADAPPHDENFGAAWRAAEAARAKRILITPIAASGVADQAEYAMRAMAAATQSRYLFLTDDSGIGNPHAAPAIDCYLVTRLDALVRRVVDSQLSGRRVEPEAQEVIRSVGKYDAGKCLLPPDYRWDQG